MDIVTLDFETYYSKEYSLSKMTTEAYVRDPRFEVIGVAVKVNDGETDWYTGEDPGRFLDSLDYSDKAILCHNTAFDGAILSWHYGIRPAVWLDTLSMSRPLLGATTSGALKSLAAYFGVGVKGTEVEQSIGLRREDFSPQQMAQFGRYCMNDVELTYAIWRKMKRYFSVFELRSIDQILRMFIEPVLLVDEDLLTSHLEDVQTAKAQLLDDIGATAKHVASSAKFAALLRAEGVEPPTKISPRTGKETYAFAKTDEAMTQLCEHESPRVQALAAARLGVKSTLEETRTQALIGVAQRGALPILLNYYGAATGRLSGGGGLNLQNLPSRSGNNKLRCALCAPRGYLVGACDSSQIEARGVAWLAGQTDLLDAFRQKRDVYSEFASRIYGRTITKADKLERFVGKVAVLSLGYGAGAARFREMLRVMGGVIIEEDEAQHIVGLYRDTYQRIPILWRKLDRVLRSMTLDEEGQINGAVSYNGEGIWLPSNFRLQYPLLHATEVGYRFAKKRADFTKIMKLRMDGEEVPDKLWTNVWGGFLAENITQALAALIVREQMLEIGTRYPVVMQVHDEVVVVAREAERDAADAFMQRVMSTTPAWAQGWPLACESGWGENYGDAK